MRKLTDRYLSRSVLFWKYSQDAEFAKLQKAARAATWKNLVWNWAGLGVSIEGRAAAERLGFVPTEVFAHPEVLKAKPKLLEYYRLLACLPNKGLSQIKAKTKGRQTGDVCILLNQFLSSLLASAVSVNRDGLLNTIFAEAGSEWQGTWVNAIGQLAARELENLITGFARQNKLLDETVATAKKSVLVLKSGTTIAFGSEPDVECRDAKKKLLCVIEVKGSGDKAGAQTRLGETKKSFTKAKLENPRCVTVFLPSILTSAVEKQLLTERDIDKVFNLLDLFKHQSKRDEFAAELFKFILREKI